MDANRLGALALVLGSVGVLLLAALAIVRIVLVQRAERALLHALDRRAAAVEAAAARAGSGEAAREAAAPVAPRVRFARLRERFEDVGMRWLDTGFSRYLIADEDRRLLEQCGFVDVRARALFVGARIVCAILLPALAVLVLIGRGQQARWPLWLSIALVTGYMLPKIYVRRRATARRQSLAAELPLLVDMLRLLQGVGLSLDQSIQVVTHDFQTMLPVLSWELGVAQRQFAAGRTREQSLQRLTNSFDNEDLRAIVRLLIQVDKHGGAVQEPLKQFGDRLREGRRATLREQIGRLTVKMTGVMIVTLLPALLIVTAGPGIMTVLSALAAFQR
ncbi:MULTISPECIES: type II secretion system F family protein [Burkholderia cepacia complex]|uniref:type II secretion system F family protein n=2 Tax=Burkholderia TaxID=32008 RepID=UPI0006AC02E4|nr:MULTISPECIES: type II secretion system F family protein [Burkholderia cepacia complex]KOR19329.1 membrane protein [Burkholderia cenocepacia]MBR7979258.1 type II secretion system F family protein [Burkholderia cenocepacia]MBR7986943.1 type II secretion system F family protein [Burkholderia cenocepacia]MBR8196412.1 type II secretion system F family protein [Burkholderia cenocepacia]MBR8319000.1 type II secretion system F family protein [Burkholderia cenocepacia]